MSSIRQKLTSLCLMALLATGCGHAPTTAALQKAATAVRTASVPDGFLWGTSTAGYQWEGGDSTSQWAKWDTSGRTTERNVAGADGWHRYAEDAALTKGLGCNSFRTSIEWARVEPQEGVYDPAAIAHYHQVLAALTAQGLQPIVTLMHFAYPSWLDAEGGWENPETARKFADYAAFVAREFGPQIKYYLTYNEPNAFLLAGWAAGVMPPGKQDPIAGVRAMENMITGHRMAYDAVHANDPDAQVSFNMYTADFALGVTNYGLLSVAPQSEADVDTQRLGSNTYFMDQLTTMDKVTEGFGEHGTLDYTALDYYCKLHVALPFALPRPDLWEVDPNGFYDQIKSNYAKYHLPVLIAENGLATWDLAPRADGWTRSKYMVAHVAAMQHALADGVPVIGYVHWSITDNYEWGSFSPRFGLYSVDCRHGNYTRVPNDGVAAMQAITASHGVTQAISARYMPPGSTPIVFAPVEPNGGSAVHSW